jgi:type I restriction enzyme S subunit
MSSARSEVALGDVCKVLIGPAFKSELFTEVTSDPRLLRGINVGPGTIRWHERRAWPIHLSAQYAAYRLKARDVVVAMDATITSDGAVRSATIGSDDLPALLVQRVACLRPRGPILPEYVALVVSCNAFADRVRMLQTGAFAPHISGRTISEFVIALPTEQVQRRIVDLVASLDRANAAAERVVATSGAALYSLERKVFSEARGLEVSLGDVVSFAGGCAFPITSQGRRAGPIPFYKVSDMNSPGNEVVLSDAANYVDEVQLRQLGGRVWPSGTVVFPKVGAALLTEKRRILSVDSAFDNNVMGLVPSANLHPRYLLSFMRTVRLGAVAQHGAIASVNQSHLRDLKIPLPPHELQQEAVAVIEGVEQVLAAAARLCQRFRDLRAALLKELLAGEGEIPETYDSLLEWQ